MFDRCQVIGEDAFTAVPTGYDIYLLSRVINSWDDEHAIAFLTRCHQAMKPQGKVLLVERVTLADRTAELLVLESDLHLLVGRAAKNAQKPSTAHSSRPQALNSRNSLLC